MMSLFRWGVVPVFLTVFPGMAQDVAAPSMANVDLETEEGKKMAAYQEAVDRHLRLGIVCTYIMERKMEGKGDGAVLRALLKYIQSPEWLKTLDQCPFDYRNMHLKIIEGSKKLLERAEKEKMTDGEFLEAYEKYGAACMKMGAGIMEKYQLENCSVQFFSFLVQETKGVDEAEKVKVLDRIKKDLLTGKLKIPDENERME